jgi:hypothetical protein
MYGINDPLCSHANRTIMIIVTRGSAFWYVGFVKKLPACGLFDREADAGKNLVNHQWFLVPRVFRNFLLFLPRFPYEVVVLSSKLRFRGSMGRNKIVREDVKDDPKEAFRKLSHQLEQF